jgi:Rieske Fe-S protein
VKTDAVLHRRSFVKTFALVSASVCLGGKHLKSLFITEVEAQSTSQIGIFRLSLDDFPDLQNNFGSVRLTVPGMPPTFPEIIVTRVSNTTFYAVTSRCTHQGCTVEPHGVFSQNLECPCHGSRFSPSGSVVRGPATAALTRYTVTFDGIKIVAIAIPNLGYSMTVGTTVNPTTGGPRMRLEFPTITGLQYEIRFRPSMTEGDWSPVSFAATLDGEATTTVLTGNNRKATVYVDRSSDLGLYAVIRY